MVKSNNSVLLVETQENFQSDEQVSFTCYINARGNLSKSYVVSNGAIVKTPAASLTDGVAERLEIPFEEFPKFLSYAESNMAFGYGTHSEEFPEQVTIATHGTENPDFNVLARTQDYFTYPKSAGILMLDHDPSQYGETISAEEFLKILGSIDQNLAKAAKVIKPSVSAGVGLVGAPPSQDKGYHVYIPVMNAADIPRYGKLLFDRLWLAGYGFIALSSNGAMLIRSVIDEAVFSPERLDFVGKPVIDSADLEYTPIEPILISGGMLDTSLLAELTSTEKMHIHKLIGDKKAAISDQAHAKKLAWNEGKVLELVHKGISKSEAQTLVDNFQQGRDKDLHEDFILYFCNPKLGCVTVKEVIDNPTTYDEKALADPIEGTEYGSTTAKFYWNDGKPIINSFAHGGQKYYLHSLNNESESTDLIQDRNGKYLATLNNIVNALSDRDFCDLEIRLDEFTEQINISWSNDKFIMFSDHDYAALRMRLPKLGFHEIGDKMIATAVKFVAFKNKYDSAQDWINSLEWDGIPRVEQYFSQYMSTSDSAYARAVAKYMFTAVVGRILIPGCQADMVPIFVGAQGVGKSSAISALLVNQDTFTEISLDEKDADISRKIRGTLLAELPELRGLRKVDVESLKAFITRRKEKWVAKYVEFASEYQRRVVFIGTTNEDAFLGDSTGNRRFLPITVGKADILAIQRDRLQLWAESVSIYRENDNEICWKEAESLAKLELDQYELKEPWHDLIAEWVIPLSNTDASFTTENILNSCLNIDTKHHDRASVTKVQNVMKTLGYKSTQKKIGKIRKSVWVKK